MQNTLVKNFKNFLFQEELLSWGDKIVVGISGGLDSVGLVRLLLAVKKKFNLELCLVHINYHLRGEDSDEDEEFVKKFAKEYGLELRVIDYGNKKPPKVFVPQTLTTFTQGVDHGIKSGGNLEEKLREFRYGIFEEIRQEKKFDWIAVAHHQDDQVETFLMNLFRGAGIDGLKGMLVKDKERKIIRPVLSFSKGDIRNFLKAVGQGWREDTTNKENLFLRNKIRNVLIPFIEKEYSPQFKQRVAGVTVQLQEYFSLADIMIEKEMEAVVKVKDNNGVIVDVRKYLALNSGLRALVFRRIVKEVNGSLKNISRGNYFEFEKMMKSNKGKNQVMTIGDLGFERIGNEIRLFDKRDNK